jgi:hypothetical protein
MIRTEGLNKEFDKLLKNDVAARYVVKHRKIPRNKKVPRIFRGKNPDGSVRTQKEFRHFASLIRLWEKRIKEQYQAEKKRLRLEQAEKKRLRLALIKIKIEQKIAKKALADVRIRLIAERVKERRRWWHSGQVINFKKPDGTSFREVVTKTSRELIPA